MADVYDIKQMDIALKAGEGMIAYAGFSIQDAPEAGPRDGILKISAFQRHDGSGYLTLTFLVDTEGNSDVRDILETTFNTVTEAHLRTALGSNLEMLIKNVLHGSVQSEPWCLMEFSIYLKELEGNEQTLLEKKILPCLAPVLGCTFGTLEWWDEEIHNDFSKQNQSGETGLKALFRKFFGT